jgi:hypothetical protein
MDNARLTAVLGQEPQTPLDEAAEATLIGLSCINTPDGHVRVPARF